MMAPRLAPLALALTLALTTAIDPRNFTEDTLLPGFHFVPWPFDWMNDPNGPMYDPMHELYHLMYQYQTPRNWGHAVSKDLVNWVQLPQALTRTQSYDAGGDFSGSATILDDDAQTPVLTVSTNNNDMVFVALPEDRTNDPCVIVCLCAGVFVFLRVCVGWSRCLCVGTRASAPRVHDAP